MWSSLPQRWFGMAKSHRLLKVALWVIGTVLSALIGLYVSQLFTSDPELDTHIGSILRDDDTDLVVLRVANYGEVDLTSTYSD